MSSHPESLVKVRERYGLRCAYSNEREGVIPQNEYRIIGDDDKELIGIVQLTSGRFGNAIIGSPLAIALAQHLKLRHFRLPDVEGLHFEKEVLLGGLTILPAQAPLPIEGCFLSGPFDQPSDFPILPSLSGKEQTSLLQEFLRPCLKLKDKPSPDSELVIHIRSGDIFAGYVHGFYVQPPLSFYQAVVRDLTARHLIDRVKVVFEDRGNPTIEALLDWLDHQNVSTTIQSEGFVDDLSHMIDAKHFCFGVGSLGPAVCKLSRSMKTAHHFQARPTLSGLRLHSVGEVNEYTLKDEFIPVGSWANTNDQRRLMIQFPQTGLERWTVQDL